MLTDEIGDDPVQPRARLSPRQVVAAPSLEGDHEGLRHQIVRHVGTQPPGRVPVDVVGVAVEQHGEGIGLFPGPFDHRGVGVQPLVRALGTVDSDAR